MFTRANENGVKVGRLDLRWFAKGSRKISLRRRGNNHYVTGSKRQATVEPMGFEDDYWETGLGFQRGEERYWDTGDLWEKVDRFGVTCPRSKHFGRYGSVIGVSKKRLWVVFDDIKKPGSFVERTMVVHAPPDWESSRRGLKAKRENRNYMGPIVLRFL
jgi:hypothetical protein